MATVYKKGLNQLSAAKVAKIKDAGMYNDGGGLYLRVKITGSASWVFRFMRNDKAREMGLGPYPLRSLADARTEAAKCRNMLLMDQDPLAARASSKGKPTFLECAQQYIDAQSKTWTGKGAETTWKNSLIRYTSKAFGNVSVDKVTTDMIIKALKKPWVEKHPTASKVRQRIETVLDYAKVHGHRSGENPARWEGHLAQVLPPPSRVYKTVHQVALPYTDVHKFIADLHALDLTSARALELTILTAVRTAETIKAHRDEFDMVARVWSIPAARTKTGKEHRVPLCPRAYQIVVASIRDIPDSGYLFPGPARSGLMGVTAMLELAKRMGYGEDITVHGFRSCFRDWAAEKTEYANEVVEAALAHTIKSKVEAAYRRGDLLDRRTPLMNDWGTYCTRQVKDADPPRPSS